MPDFPALNGTRSRSERFAGELVYLTLSAGRPFPPSTCQKVVRKVGRKTLDQSFSLTLCLARSFRLYLLRNLRLRLLMLLRPYVVSRLLERCIRHFLLHDCAYRIRQLKILSLGG